MGSIRRSKAPRAQRTALPFAGERTRRPYKAHRPKRWARQNAYDASNQSGGTVTREGHSTPRAARNATRGVRADRVGAKSIPRAIAVSKVKARGNCPEPNPLTRDISTGCAPKGELPSAVSPLAVERPTKAKTSCADGPPSVMFCGVRWVRGGARGSDRWQKSTGGARPVAAGCDEHPPTAIGLASRARQPGCERASEAEIAGAKLRLRWRVRHRRKVIDEHLSMEGASSCLRLALDEGESRDGSGGMREDDSSLSCTRDRKRQRFASQVPDAAENAAAERSRKQAGPSARPKGTALAAMSTEAGGASSNAPPTGARSRCKATLAPGVKTGRATGPS